MNFLDLPIDKLKNKVICDLHFQESCFMNFTRGKLNKTSAVPTIYINDDKSEIDLQVNPLDYVVTNKKKPIPDSFLKADSSAHIDIEGSSCNFTIETIDEAEVSTPAMKKLKREVAPAPVTTTVRILNKSVVSSPAAIARPKTTAAPIIAAAKKIVTPVVSYQKKPAAVANTVEVIPFIEYSSPLSSPTKSVGVAKSEALPPSIEPLFEIMPEVIPQTIPSVDELKPLLMDSLAQIAELKKLVKETKSTEVPTASPAKPECSNISQSHMNKAQLFNGIKRYISPAMIALLRIELFSTPGREFKKDEKIICSEIMKLGDGVYDFLSEEWRLRLPQKQEVQQWMQAAEAEDDDDDAS